MHDVISNFFARKAIEKGADGLIPVAAGAGGHASRLSPFAMVQELREWFDGPIALSGSIANGGAILAAQAMGADLAYIGSAFIATQEANAMPGYKQMIVERGGEDIVYTNLFTGVLGNYLRPSIERAGLDPDNLPTADPSKMNFDPAATRRPRPGATSGAVARALARSSQSRQRVNSSRGSPRNTKRPRPPWPPRPASPPARRSPSPPSSQSIRL